MKIKVSVIIPVYNCISFLERAIESVVNQQDFYENELILVDDGSTDGSSDLCDVYQKKYDNIKVIHQHNSGVSVARNNGIRVAKGEWIFFLDSDDYLLADAFNKMFANGAADIICASYESNSCSVPDFEDVIKSGIYNKNDITDELNWLLASSHQFMYTCWSKLFKRSLIDSFGISFPEGRKYAEDMVFVYTYLRYSKNISFVNEKIYFYYVNTENATSVIPKSFDTYYFIFKWKSDYFQSIGCYCEKIEKWLISSFLFKTFFSIKSAATYLNKKESIEYINQILNNDVFYNYYINSDEYSSFKTKADKFLDIFIRKKKPLLIFILFKIINFKTVIFKR